MREVNDRLQDLLRVKLWVPLSDELSRVHWRPMGIVRKKLVGALWLSIRSRVVDRGRSASIIQAWMETYILAG